ncbi:unnamed protein product [Cuscuta epithymum]|uniref:RING-type E3 ubiquitin transferase n=1 Tax=Cuscuta epithymum TaxID=186058 RepID=A0AAV0DF41_9ASTE|nr:unnamed protein product [Cuscuta epithymum]
MAESSEGNHEISSLPDESYRYERPYLESIYDSFLCPLTKQVMREPVTTENGQTFEREAIEKWFKECKASGRNPVCPITRRELKSTELNPSIALSKTIKEWNARNEAAQLDRARRTLSMGNASETEILRVLQDLVNLCQKSRSNTQAIRNADLIPMIIEMLRSSSRRVPLKALETLRATVEHDDANKDILAEGDTVRTIVKFLHHKKSKEREEAVSLLFELSKSKSLSEKIGSINGAILILVGMASSSSENVVTVERAEKTLVNLEKCESNVRQLAENGRLWPLLTLLLEGSNETKLSMAAFLGDLVLNNDVKVLVAKSVGPSLINMMREHGSMEAREVALKALNQISSYEVSSKLLISAGILSPLVRDLFAIGANALPMRLKQVSATILANIVNSGYDFDSKQRDHQNLVSEDTIHNFLQLISNTGPAIESKLLQVLVGLTSSSTTVTSVVSAIRSSGAAISLVQFIEAPQKDLRVASIKLLQNLSPHMGEELAGCLSGTSGQLGSLIKVISENTFGITEEQAAAVCLLADLPERDIGLTRQMLDEKFFQLVISRVDGIRHGERSGGRFVTPFLEGLVKVLSRITFVLSNEPDALAVCREYNVASLLIELLKTNGLDNVQMVSAMALENLSQESKNLTKLPELPKPGFCISILPCLGSPHVITGLCKVHRGTCSLKETFCLLEGQGVEKLVALLDHTNEKVVEASLAALSTLLDDGVDIEQGVQVLCDAEGIRPILDVLLEKRTENLRRRAVWAVERLLRTDDIAYEVSGDPNLSTALVDAFQNADYPTKQIAERALRHVDKIPDFSGVFPNMA